MKTNIITITVLVLSSLTLSCANQARSTNGTVILGKSPNESIPASEARLNYPQDAVRDSKGNIYISDTHLHVIRKISGNSVDVFAGAFAAGYNNEKYRKEILMNTPTGLMLSSDEKFLLVADSGNALIRMINIETGEVTTIAGVQGLTSELPSDGINAAGNPIGYASVLKTDPAGRLCYQSSKMSSENTAIDGGIFCIDQAGITRDVTPRLPFKPHGIRDFLIDEKYIALIRGKQAIKVTTEGKTFSYDFPIQHGKGIIKDGDGIIMGNHTVLYRFDEGFSPSPIENGFANISNVKRHNNEIIITDSDQGVIYTIDGKVKKQITGHSPNVYGAITSITRFGENKLLILDNQKPRIFLYDIKTQKTTLWAGNGKQALASVEVDKLKTSFYYPRSITSDGKNVYIAEPHRIMRIDNSGKVTRYAGYEMSGDVDSNIPTDARFKSISSISMTSGGDILVADTYNNKIRKIDRNGAVSTIAGTGVPGVPKDGDLAIDSKINHPLSASENPSGDIIVSDSWNNSAFIMTSDKRIKRFAGIPVFSTYQGKGFFEGDEGQATEAQMNTPSASAFDDQGNVFISDLFNHRIRKVSPEGFITTFSGDKQGYAPNGKTLNFPTSIAIVGGYLYVTDTGNRLVIQYPLN